jgi:nitroreductase
METILGDLHWRYAVKKFDSTKRLTEEQLNTLLEVIRLAPTAYGLQPIEAIIVQSAELREQLLPHSFGQRQVIDASHLIVLCAQKSFDSSDIDNHIRRTENIRQFEKNTLNNYSDFLKRTILDQDAKSIVEWNSKQAYLVIGMLLHACAQLKIDATPMEGFNPEGYARIIGLDENKLQPVLLLPVGYRHEEDTTQHLKKVRKEPSEIIRFLN